jgi:predicted ribosome quality control (RQC) complex YloA/Tae2 family protein
VAAAATAAPAPAAAATNAASAPTTPPPPPPAAAAAVDYTTLLACCRELADPANGYLPAKVEEVVQSDAHTLALRLRTAGPHALSPPADGASSAATTPHPQTLHRYWLYVSWHPTAARLCASASDPPRGAASEAYAFGEQAGRLLRGLALCRVSLPRAWERSAALDFGPRPSDPPTRRLHAEVMGKHSNAVLTDAGSGSGGGFGGGDGFDEPAAAGGGASSAARGASKKAPKTKRQRMMMMQQEEEEAERRRQEQTREAAAAAPAAAASSGVRGAEQQEETVLAAGLQVGERQSSLRQLAAGRPFEPPPAALGLAAMASGLLPDAGEALEEWRRNVEGASGLLLAASQAEQEQRGKSGNDNSSWHPSFADCLVRAYVGVSPALAAEIALAAGIEQQLAGDSAGTSTRRARRGPLTPPPSALSDDDWARAHAAWRRWIAFVEDAHAVLGLGTSTSVAPSDPPAPWLDRATGRYSAVGLWHAPTLPAEADNPLSSSHPRPFSSANALLDALHGPASQARAAHAQLHAKLTAAARTALQRCEGRAAAFRRQLVAAEAADAVRREADLVMANLYRIPLSDAAPGSRAGSVLSSTEEEGQQEQQQGANNDDAAANARCELGPDGSWRVTLQDWETGEDVILSLDGVGGALLSQSAAQQLRRDAKKKQKGAGGDAASSSPSSPSSSPLSPRAHAEALYKRARKLRRAVDAVAPLLAAAESEAAYLAELAASVEALERFGGGDDLAALRSVEAELRQLQQSAQLQNRAGSEAAMAAKGAAKGRKAAKQREKVVQQQQDGGARGGAAREDVGAAATVDGARPRRFVSPGGRVVLVGRHNRQNDVLSLKAAAPQDVWMHVRGVPGSHVVLRATGGGGGAALSSSSSSPPSSLAPEVSEACVQFAADLAVFYSKARQSGKADVVVCRAGQLKKPKGARPGQVLVGSELGNAVGRPDRVAALAEGGGSASD